MRGRQFRGPMRFMRLNRVQKERFEEVTEYEEVKVSQTQ